MWGSSWGVDDLVSTISSTTNGGASTFTLSPNTIDDPSDYWYIGGGAPGSPGNKTMDANLFYTYTDSPLSGQTVTFSGTVVANTLSNSHTAVAFIKDFAPDFSSNIPSPPTWPRVRFRFPWPRIPAPGGISSSDSQ